MSSYNMKNVNKKNKEIIVDDSFPNFFHVFQVFQNVYDVIFQGWYRKIQRISENTTFNSFDIIDEIWNLFYMTIMRGGLLLLLYVLCYVSFLRIYRNISSKHNQRAS